MSAVEGFSNEELLAEVRRRGLLTELHGAVGALYDHLEHRGDFMADERHTRYLAFRLRREDSRAAGYPDSAAVWQQSIDEMDAETLEERSSQAPSHG